MQEGNYAHTGTASDGDTRSGGFDLARSDGHVNDLSGGRNNKLSIIGSETMSGRSQTVADSGSSSIFELINIQRKLSRNWDKTWRLNQKT